MIPVPVSPLSDRLRAWADRRAVGPNWFYGGPNDVALWREAAVALAAAERERDETERERSRLRDLCDLRVEQWQAAEARAAAAEEALRETVDALTSVEGDLEGTVSPASCDLVNAAARVGRSTLAAGAQPEPAAPADVEIDVVLPRPKRKPILEGTAILHAPADEPAADGEA